jgi:hypothetical protein
MFDIAAGALVLLIALALQVLATIRVKRDDGSSPEQKGMQLRLIWLLPLLGAALVLAVLHESPSSHSPRAEQGSQRTSARTPPPPRQRRPS